MSRNPWTRRNFFSASWIAALTQNADPVAAAVLEWLLGPDGRGALTDAGFGLP